MITQEELRSLIHYNPRTGVFTRLVPTKRQCKGEVAGSISPQGYRQIHVKDRTYTAHRLAWLYMTGEHPNHAIDHINGNGTDNRWRNLRKATHSENQQNRSIFSGNLSGRVGVTIESNHLRPFRASISLHGVSRVIGYFNTREEAHHAYLDAKKRLHRFQRIPRELTSTL